MTKNLSRRFNSLIKVDHNVDLKTATITMNNGPVNSLSLEMLQALSGAIKEVEASSAHGFVLSSSSKNVFSAGLDITEMHNPTESRLREFWSTLQDTWLALVGTNSQTHLELFSSCLPSSYVSFSMARLWRLLQLSTGMLQLVVVCFQLRVMKE